jgi:hypothetical protein
VNPLSEELSQALAELRTWAHLHASDDDTDIGIWRALVTIDKAVSALRIYEEAAS